MNKTIAQQVNEKASGRNVPLNAVFELTYRCNQRCSFCFQQNYSNTPELSPAFWTGVLDQLAECGTLYCAFTGGEPLLHPGFMEILAHARAKTFAVSIISNGTLIDKRMAERLAGAGIMDIGISLLAASPEMHDKLSGVQGSFCAALNAIGLLVKAGVRVLIKHTVTKDNFGEYGALSKIADEQGCLLEYDTVVLPPKSGVVSPVALTFEELREFYLEAHVNPPECSHGSPWRLHCDAGRSVCGISPCGDVVPCIQLALPFGNLQHEKFEKIWNSDAAKRFRELESEASVQCAQCPDMGFCMRCHGVALMESGRDFRGPSGSLCTLAKVVKSLPGDSPENAAGK